MKTSVRNEDGTITTFDAPGAGMSGTTPFSGTTPISNNATNWITGYYFDANGVGHGFLRIGHRCAEGRQGRPCNKK